MVDSGGIAMKLNRSATVQSSENLLVQLVEPILKQMEDTRIFAVGRLRARRKRKVAEIRLASACPRVLPSSTVARRPEALREYEN
jgi:hypothetical protein